MITEIKYVHKDELSYSFMILKFNMEVIYAVTKKEAIHYRMKPFWFRTLCYDH